MSLLRLLVLIVLALPSNALATHVPLSEIGDDPEAIISLDVTLAITKDGGVIVTEDIVYDFGANNKHGFIREIPLLYESLDGHVRRMPIEGVRVTGDQGDLDYTGTQKIIIGREDRGVTGQQRYVISYAMPNSIVSQEGKDVLFWDVVGNGFEVPVVSTTARVSLPDGSFSEAVCFADGEESDGCYVTGMGTGDLSVGSTDELDPGEPLTVVAAFPKGLVEPAGSIRWDVSTLVGSLEVRDSSGRTLDTREPMRAGSYTAILDYRRPYYQDERYQVDLGVGENRIYEGAFAVKSWYLLLRFAGPVGMVLLSLGAFFVARRRWAQHEKGYATVVPQYVVQKEMHVAMAAYLVNGSVNMRTLIGLVLELATKGYLTIEKEKGGFVIKQSSTDRKLNGIQELVLKKLFAKKAQTVRLEDAVERLWFTLYAVRDLVETESRELGYYTVTPPQGRARIILLLVSLLVVGISLSVLGVWWNLWLLAAVAPLAPFILVPILLHPGRRTQKGSEARDYLRGYKEYLEVVEEDRVAFSQTPAEFEGAVQNLLPYAVVMGIDDTWLALVKKYLPNTEYDWFTGQETLTKSLPALLRTASKHPTQNRSGSSSSGTSFGGSSSSGGGFGGGGGRSW